MRGLSNPGLTAGVLLAAAACIAAAAAEVNCAQLNEAVAGRPPLFVPGQTTKVLDAAAGQLGYYVVYTPKDYTDDVKWPVVFFYHGLGGEPEADTLSDLLDGEDFIVVGMPYHVRGMEGYQFLKTRDVEILKHVLAELDGPLAVDRKRLFVSGFSKGGFYTCALLNELPDLWAGAVVLGAGARTKSENPAALSGKPVFVGCGRDDPFLKDAVEACIYYRSLGCRITYECWPETGHSVSERNTIGQWLRENAGDDQRRGQSEHRQSTSRWRMVAVFAFCASGVGAALVLTLSYLKRLRRKIQAAE